jgi:CheY-like chemotaxis protein
MAQLLVVDDSVTDRRLIGRLLEKRSGHEIRYAEDGQAAIEMIRAERPDLIVSDLQMPRMNGLQLVAEVRRECPQVPVILMTARGSEQIAAEALRAGAASYVPKSAMGAHLLGAVDQFLAAAQDEKLHSRLMHSLKSDQCCFVLRNDPELIEPLVGHVQELLRCIKLEDQAERLRVCVAVRQALRIAHYHGNLEIPLDSAIDDEGFQSLAQEREMLAPYDQRTVTFRLAVTSEELQISVNYDGPAIDFTKLPADLAERAAEASWLSGFLLIPAIIDEVDYRSATREIALFKKSCVPDLDDDLAIGTD